MREPHRRVIDPGRGNWTKKEGIVSALKAVYQKFKCHANEINFVGFCKMKMGIFLES